MTSLLRFVLVSCALLLTFAAEAQRREVYDVVLVPEAQVEVGLTGDDYLLAAVSLVAPTGSSGDGATFGGGQLRLGYEHFWSKQWSYGATLRLLNNDGYGDILGLQGRFIPGALLRHRGTLGPVSFNQRLALEYATSLNSGDASDEDGRGLARLRFDVEYPLPVSEKVALHPRLAYEAAAYLRLQREEGQTKERVIDFGNLRAEVGIRLSPRVDITPWVSYQTTYINSLPQYREEVDATGNIIQIQTSGGRTNLVLPVAGIDLRFTLPTGSTSSDRTQLPSQH